MPPARGFDAVVVGSSAGGLDALTTVLGGLPSGYGPAVALVQHVGDRGTGLLSELLAGRCVLPVVDAERGLPLIGGRIHVAPSGYHMLIEEDRTLSLSVDPRVRWSRPSIDVLFESAADAFGPRLLAVLLTGANNDGADGMVRVAEAGGFTVVQDPETAYAPAMPAAAIEAVDVDHVGDLQSIASLLARVHCRDVDSPGEGG